MDFLYELKNKFTFFDIKLAKQIIIEEIDIILRGKNEKELKEELRKEFEELKAKQKKGKKNFSERR